MSYSFREFVEKISGTSCKDAIRQAQEEYTQIKGARGKKADALRKAGAIAYMRKLGAFLFHIQNGFSDLGEEDTKLIRPIVEKWIERKGASDGKVTA